MADVVLETNLSGLKKINRGKVRDLYEVGDNLLLVTTDRISAFDVVFPNGIPDKGKVLNQISLFWFDYFKSTVPNHIITSNVDEMPEVVRKHAAVLRGRCLLAKKARVFQVECIARGHVVGSGWKDYQKTGAICGIKLPGNLKLCDKLEQPIFTPSTKAESGHDENISFERMVEIIGRDAATTLRDKTLDIFTRAREYTAAKGIIIADTKLEWGLIDGKISLVDEVLSPDSSRFWPASEYEPGKNQASFDKQFVRDFLETTDWNKEPPAPALPADIVEKTAAKYREAYEKLTGKKLQ